MTQIISFEISKVKGLFVVVPEWADYRLDDSEVPNKFYIFKRDRNIHYGYSETLPQGNWQLLGLLNEVSEEQAAEVVDMALYSFFKDYETDKKDEAWVFARPSLYSLARSLNVPENSVVLMEKK